MKHRKLLDFYAPGFLEAYYERTMNAVESPQHYTQGYLEVIYVIEQVLGKDGFKSFCLGNWIKYKTRHEHKNGAEDLAKAEQYLAWANNGLPPPVNGRVPRKQSIPHDISESVLSGSLSALLQHELDVLVPGVWKVERVSSMRAGGNYRVSADIKKGEGDKAYMLRVVLNHVVNATMYADIVYDMIDDFKKQYPEGPWRSA